MGTGHAANARDSINAHKIIIGKLHGEKSLVRAVAYPGIFFGGVQ